MATKLPHTAPPIIEKEKDPVRAVAYLMMQKIRGRSSVFAEKVADGYRPVKKGGKTMPLSVEHVMKHLKNPNSTIGIYITDEGQDSSYSAVLDFDDHSGTLAPEVMEEVVVNCSKVVTNMGLTPLVFRSGGGKGIHIWLTFEEPVKNWKLKLLCQDILSKTESHIDGEKT
jgi:hypothetical protein